MMSNVITQIFTITFQMSTFANPKITLTQLFQIFRKSIPADLPKSIKIEVFFTLQCCHCESSFIRNSLYEFAPTTRTYSFGEQYSVLFESVSPCTTNFTCFPIPHPPSCGSWPFLRVVNRDCLWPLGQASPAQ